jgi:hypothetical protein
VHGPQTVSVQSDAHDDAHDGVKNGESAAGTAPLSVAAVSLRQIGHRGG